MCEILLQSWKHISFNFDQKITICSTYLTECEICLIKLYQLILLDFFGQNIGEMFIDSYIFGLDDIFEVGERDLSVIPHRPLEHLLQPSQIIPRQLGLGS